MTPRTMWTSASSGESSAASLNNLATCRKKNNPFELLDSIRVMYRELQYLTALSVK